MSLLSVKDAQERIRTYFQPVETERLALTDCAKRVLAEEISAPTDLPSFDNSSMDGFAVRVTDAESTDGPRRLRVVEDIPAGYAPTKTLTAREAARIMTGAQVPAGAEAVVPVEDTDFEDRSAGSAPPEWVTILKAAKAGDNIRKRGIDLQTGDVVLHAGRRLKPQDLGLLAMLGYATVSVYGRPRVGLFSSGNELLDVSAALEPGKIRDSNSYMLAALLEEAGIEVLRLGVARDEHASVRAVFEKAREQAVDLILSSAGVSVGAFDYVKEVIEEGGRMDFWRVNMRPGKPLAFGEYQGLPFLGLPGNPVSAFVGFEVFVRTALGRLSGLQEDGRPTVRVRPVEQIDSDGRESYLRARVQADPSGSGLTAELAGHQGSGNLHSLVWANALLIIPAGVKCVPAGQEVDAWLI